MTAPANAVELAVAYVSVVPETSKIARGIKDAIRGGQLYANRNPINIKANVDVSHIGGVEIPALVDTTRFDAGIRDALREAQTYATAHPIDIRANVDVSHVGNVAVDVVPDFGDFGDRMSVGLAIAQASHNWTVNVGVDVDGAGALAQMSSVHAALQGMASPIHQEVNVDVDRRGGAATVGSLVSGLGSVGAAAGGLSAVAAGIAAIGGAAGAAVGAVGTLGVGLASLGPAAAAGIATVAVGMQGVGDAFKALSAAEDAAGTDMAAQAKAVSAANDQLESAIEGVATAQRSQADAVKDAKDAHQDIARAYKDAADELEDYQFKLKDAALSEQEAALAVREARDELAKAKPEDREKAALRLQRAELRYQEAVEKNKDTQEQANEAFQKGVEGSDKVVAAKDKAAKADERVADADRAVEKAHAQVAKAQQAVTDAMNSGSSAQDKAAQALAKLSPAAQAAVLATRDLAPLWKDLKNATQEALFADAAQGITELATAAMPTLKAGMVDVAASMNGLTKQFAAFWAAPENLAGVQAAFAGASNFIDGLGPGLQQATQGFLSLGQAFEPVANQVGAQLGGMLGQIGQAFTTTFQNGELTQLISTFGDTLQGLGEGLNPLIQGLIQMGNIVGPTLGPLFKTLGESLGALGPSLGQLGATFSTTLTGILPDLSKFIDALAKGLEPVLPVIGDLLQSMMTALTPLIGPLSQIAQVVGTALSQAITALAPSIGPIGDAFASLFTAISPILPVLAEIASGILQALAPALTTIFDALAPVIQQWGDLLLPAFKQLQPILADVATTLGNALADALVQISPYIPDMAKAFTDLVMAFTPLLPELARLVADLLPPMLDLFVSILPQVIDLTKAFTWLANNVIVPILIPAIRGMSEYLTDQLESVSKAITTARDFWGGALDKMGSFFRGLGDTVAQIWDGIVRSVAIGVRSIGEILQKAGDSPIPFPGRGKAAEYGSSLTEWANAHMAAGGLLSGPGTGTSDSMLIAASTGEYIVNASATAANLPLLEAINAGWIPTAEFLHGMIPGFREGGLVPGKAFAQSMDSATYLMGGYNRQQIDCSGIVSAVVNDALGLDPFSPRMSTINEGQWLAAKGAKPGLGPAGSINIGWFDHGGGANGHTALTLGDGTNVESNSSDGVVIGGPVGATHKMFDKHMHIPPELLRGGDLGTSGGSGATKGGRPGKLGGSAGTGGTGTGSGATGAGADASGTDAAGATPVLVTNWPPQLSVGGPATTGLAPGELSTATYGPAATAPTTTPSTVAPNAGADSKHPLAGLPIPGVGKLFDGPAPWYLAATPEQALANLGSQAAGLAQRTGSDFQSLIQNNWREMLDTGLAVAGMGASGGFGSGMPPMTVINNGMDPNSAAAAVERVVRRRTLATQRSGGFGR
ncbi:hypothetical protein [Nocardia araoensis]|uniref:hypothetical protein n=1 Tax=Nocardia araoensis TaxID=228600 RepID=UPI000585559D|nr:hypothetical protein [Nocardia araoensis]